MSLREDIRHAINCACAENTSNTPDFILAEFLTDCLNAYDVATQRREKWYGRNTTSGCMPLDRNELNRNDVTKVISENTAKIISEKIIGNNTCK